MVNSSTQALSATASRCDELKQQQLALAVQLQEEKGQRLALQQQHRDGMFAAAAAVSHMRKTLLELQEAVPAAVQQAQKESEGDVYKLVAAVTHSMSSKDRAQTSELFNRAMQVTSTCARRAAAAAALGVLLLLLLLLLMPFAAVQTRGHTGEQRAR
jgi:hypothetical protein